MVNNPIPRLPACFRRTIETLKAVTGEKVLLVSHSYGEKCGSF
jgi:hypothetical protein